jgi:hypothetical protein
MKRNDILPLCNTGQVLIQIDIMIGIVVMIIVGFGPVAILSAARSGSIGILPEREQHCCKSLPNVLLKHSMTLRFNAFDTGLRNPFVHNSMYICNSRLFNLSDNLQAIWANPAHALATNRGDLLQRDLSPSVRSR